MFSTYKSIYYMSTTKQQISSCNFCSKQFSYLPSRSRGLFCSNACSGKSKLGKSEKLFEQGLLKERSTIRKCVIARDTYQCTICKITDWQGNPISLHLDHIDGNPGNNLPNNLRLLCPNCHSQTESFGAKNKGFGRKSRGLPLR